MSVRPRLGAPDLAALDLADVRVHAEHDLTEVWRHLRDERPLHWNASLGARRSRRGAGATPDGFWVLTRYTDVMSIYRDASRFSSARGNLLTSLLQGADPASGRMIAVSDGPRHTAVRKLLTPALGPRALQRLGAQVSATTQRLLSEAVDQGECDFASDVAAHIPLSTICDLLGVPDADRPFMRRQTSLALGSDEPTQSATEVWLARNEILLYFRELARARRATAGEDLISVLVSGRIDGEPIDEDEVILNCYSLILGGDETTRLSMSGTVATFAERPDEWDRFRAGQVDLASAVEEVLRWTTPAMHAGRTATEDVELHGELIRAGDIVTVWNVAANRDEREFSEPDLFDLGRSPNRHVSFGYGSHFCLGAALARIEISALLTTLRTLVSVINLNGEPGRIFSNFLAGYSTLPVAFTPATTAPLAAPSPGPLKPAPAG